MIAAESRKYGRKAMSRFKNFLVTGRAKLITHYKKILLGLAIFFALLTLVGFFVLPPIVKSVLTKQLSQNLHREVTIQKIKINPYTLSITVRGFPVKDRTGPETFASFKEIYSASFFDLNNPFC